MVVAREVVVDVCTPVVEVLGPPVPPATGVVAVWTVVVAAIVVVVVVVGVEARDESRGVEEEA